MSALAQLILLTCITGIGAGAVGAGLASVFNIDSNRTMSILLSFAAGVMLSIVCFDFIPEALELDDSVSHLLLVILAIALGTALVGVLVKIIDNRAKKHAHCCALEDPVIAQALDDAAKAAHMQLHEQQEHEHAYGHNHGHGHSHIHIPLENQTPHNLMIAGIVMAAAIAMHNIPAGMSIGASFSDPSGALIASGIVVAILMGVHSIPESISLSIPFLHAGKSRSWTILIASGVGATMVVGALIGFAVGEIDMFWMSMSLAFASGAMLYVLFGEILPEAFMLFHSKKPTIAVIVGLILGLLLTHI